MTLFGPSFSINFVYRVSKLKVSADDNDFFLRVIDWVKLAHLSGLANMRLVFQEFIQSQY